MSTHHDFCQCVPCHANKVRRIDAFCFGLLAGLNAAETAVEGPQRVGTGNLPASALTGDLDAFLADEHTGIKETVRPPRKSA